MRSQPGKQTIAIHTLLNISRTKGNQTIKFGQLIKYNIRNIFLENHTQNVAEKLFPDPFLKNEKRSCFWINRLKFYTVFFIVCQVEGHRNILKESRRPLDFISYKAFLKKTKRGVELISLCSFLYHF